MAAVVPRHSDLSGRIIYPFFCVAKHPHSPLRKHSLMLTEDILSWLI